VRVKFWGTRGSIAAPGPETVRYGGNTPCVEVSTDDGTTLVLDGGTGARKLGLNLAAGGPMRVHILVGHTHSDHIQGLPFFIPAFAAGSHITIYGPTGIDQSFPRAIRSQMDYSFFPVPFDQLPADVDFKELNEEEFTVGSATIRTQYLNHTGPCVGYRIEAGGAVVVYATDHEPNAEALWRADRGHRAFSPDAMVHTSDAAHAEFLRDADLVIHDSQYLASEYPEKQGWGHSTIEYAVDVALAARARRLALFHHDPYRTDIAMDRALAAATERADSSGLSMEVLAAAEGMELVLPERHQSVMADRATPATPLPIRPKILLAEDDDGVADTLQDILVEDGYEVFRVTDGREAVALVNQHPFDLVLLDLEMPEMNGLTVCRILRNDERHKNMPILVLTVRNDPKDIVTGFDVGATDYMTKPFKEAQLRARVRSWLTRGATHAPA
jgi:CheY-like chemotaxis protein/phosphoribosyl 1,2-cyclic phosphodiesterase